MQLELAEPSKQSSYVEAAMFTLVPSILYNGRPVFRERYKNRCQQQVTGSQYLVCLLAVNVSPSVPWSKHLPLCHGTHKTSLLLNILSANSVSSVVL